MENSDNIPDVNQLLEEVRKGNRKVLQYSRSRLLGTWLAVALLALLTSLALFLALRAADTNLEQTTDIARVAQTTADQANETADQTVAYMKGEQGIPGVPGANGEDGSPGLPGSVGEPGEPGPQGPKGDKGDAGSQGTTGLVGAAGAQGPQGPQGVFGDIGPVGPTGASGAKGDKGDQGSQGPKGDQGAQGPKGDTGPQGPAGTAPPFQIPDTVVHAAASANDDSAMKVVTATCPQAGAQISGGGFAINPSDPGLIPTASAPVGQAGWSVTVERLSLPPGTNWQVFVFAVCAVPS